MSQLPAIITVDTATLKHKARADLHFWRGVIEPLLKLPKDGILAAIRETAARVDRPWKTVHKKYLAVEKRGWMAIVERRLAGPGWWQTKADAPIGLSHEDTELVRLYALKNKSSTRAAMKQLRRDWKAGKVVTKTRIDPVTRFPRGWTTGNLARHAPPRFEIVAARNGLNAAKAHRPTVITTRKGLWKMGRVMIDDMWHNLFVNTFAENQAGRPLELFSHDLWSARKVRWGVRVHTRKADGTYNNLSERMTRMVIAATLYLDGYSPRGTIFTGVEHGTAAIPPWLEKALNDIARFPDGRPMISVERAGMTGDRAFIGQYSGLVRGNCNAKASLESSNHLTQNTFAHLPGQTGNSVENRPEEMHGSGPVFRINEDGTRVMVREGGVLWHNQCLLAARRYLAPERAEKLQFPLLELTKEFMPIADELYRGIEEDEEHDCNDWEECGFFRHQFLIGEAWVDQDAAVRPGEPGADERAELLARMIETGAVRTRKRRMSRRRVWDSGGELIRIGGHDVVAILGDDLAVERRITGNQFAFEDAEVGPGTHRFHAIAKTPWGQPVRLADGETYQTFINPFDPDVMFVRKISGEYVGECRRDLAPCREDVEAGTRKMGEVAKTVADLLVPLRKTMMADDRKTRQQQNTAEVLGQEKSDARSQERRRESALDRMAAAHSAGEDED